MGLDLSSFGPILPPQPENSLDVLKQFQTLGLPTPQNPDLQDKLLSEKIIGDQTATTFDAADKETLALGRAAEQFGISSPNSTADLTEAELNSLSQSVLDLPTDLNQISGDNPFSLPFQDDFPGDIISNKTSNITTTKDTTSQALGLAEASKTYVNPWKDQGKKEGTPPIRPSGYYKERINWEVTTFRRMKLGKPSIKFFVNPDSISYELALTQSLDQVQRGYFYTVWKDYGGNPNFFPMLKLNFKFQSSNILPETYQGKVYEGEETGSFYSQGTDGMIPPGLRNFLEIMGIFNEDRIIDITDLDESDDIESLRPLDGTPNYVLLAISTRIFPQMMMYGFFDEGLKFDEKAQDPLKFETNLNFLAFKSDPAWWDIDAIKNKYTQFWSNYFNGDSNTAPLLEDVPSTFDASDFSAEDLNNISTSNENQVDGLTDADLTPGVVSDVPNADGSNSDGPAPSEGDPPPSTDSLEGVPDQKPDPDAQAATTDYLIENKSADKIVQNPATPLSSAVPAGSTGVIYEPSTDVPGLPGTKEEKVSYIDPDGNKVVINRMVSTDASGATIINADIKKNNNLMNISSSSKDPYTTYVPGSGSGAGKTVKVSK